MVSVAEEAYLESQILSADGVELVQLLYQGALQAVENARRHLRQGNIVARSREISRAVAILAELALSVNRDADPALGRNLIELYDYMQRRLLEANVNQAEPPLAEVSRLLATMLEGWLSCKAPARPWADAKVPVLEAEPEYVSQSWSF